MKITEQEYLNVTNADKNVIIDYSCMRITEKYIAKIVLTMNFGTVREKCQKNMTRAIMFAIMIYGHQSEEHKNG